MNTLYKVSLLALGAHVFVQAQEVKQVAYATKTAFFNMEEVFKGSEEGQELVGDAQKDFQNRAIELQQQEEDLKKQFRAAGSMTKELAKKQKDIQIEGEALQGEWENLMRTVQMSVGQKITDAINRVREAQGWDAIQPGAFDVNPKCDVTKAIIENLNKEYKKEKAAKKFKKDTDKSEAAKK